MSHDDFFEATLIEFTQWDGGKEKIIARYNHFQDLPSHLIGGIQNRSSSEINLCQKSWRILEISKDLRAHGQGIHVKVRLEAQPVCQ